MKTILFILFATLAMYSAMGSVRLVDPNLPKPSFCEKKINDTLVELENLLDKGQKREFFKRASKGFAQIGTLESSRETSSKEDVNTLLWIFYLIANTPLVTMDSVEDARWAADNNDIDLRLKEDTINKLSMDRYRELLPKDKGINALFASYCAAIMRDFLDQIRAKTYSDEHIFVSEKDLQASAKRSLKIMLEEDSPKAMNEKLRDHREQFRNYTLKVNMQDRRNYQMKGIIERSEKNFMILLVELFPGKAGEIRKYIKMAGYTVPEIRDLVDRTVGREPRTEFLYKGLSKSR